MSLFSTNMAISETSQGMVYCLTSLVGSGTYAAIAHQCLCIAGPSGRLCSEATHIILLGPRRRSRHLDVANQDAGNGHRF